MPKRPITAEDLLRIHFVGDPQISPDGHRVLFSKKTVNDKNKYVSNLFSVDLDGRTRQWTQGEDGAAMGRWSRDGGSIAFVSSRRDQIAQIYVLPLEGGEARQLTALPEGSIGEIKWSPDGRWIAFAFRETDPRWTKKAAKEREEKGLSTPPREIDTIWYRMDGDGYFLNQRHALFLADVGTGEVRKLYDASWDGSYSFDWSPDGSRLAVAHTVAEHPMFDPPDDQIFLVDLEGRAEQLDGLPKGDKSAVRWSPDGHSIAYLGDDRGDDPWGVRNTKAYVVPIDGGPPRCLTAETDYDLAVATLSDTKEVSFEGTLLWSPDSRALYVSVGWHGENQLGYVDVERGGVDLMTKGRHQVTVGNLSANGERFGVLYGDAVRLNEVGVYDLGEHPDAPRALTGLNQAFHDEIELSAPEEVWLPSTDGIQVHAWALKPTGYQDGKRYPAALEIHGGPHTQYGWAFFHEFQLLAAQGYAVIYSNPRGSKGYGEDFCAAIKSNWGTKDWDDIQTVTRWMKSLPYVDASRMAVMGGSYGGFMTNWVIGHTKEFAAAITDRCVSNLVSMAGSSDFPLNRDAYFGGCAWGSHAEIEPLWRQSPLAYFQDVSTPTLIIHSEGDLRCNVEQGEQVFHALQAQKVPSRFVRYPQTTFHGLSRNGPPDLRLHRLGEILAWLDRYLS